MQFGEIKTREWMAHFSLFQVNDLMLSSMNRFTACSICIFSDFSAWRLFTVLKTIFLRYFVGNTYNISLTVFAIVRIHAIAMVVLLDLEETKKSYDLSFIIFKTTTFILLLFFWKTSCILFADQLFNRNWAGDLSNLWVTSAQLCLT